MTESITAPSGDVFDFRDQSLVWELAEVGFIEFGKMCTLKSGIKSRVYAHGRQDLTDHPQTLKHVGQAIVKRVRADIPPEKERTTCLIGVAMAGNALAQAA